jgi:hypothetical protein
MTQADAKAAVDAAFRDEVSKLFAMLVANLETQQESVAEKQFDTGFKFTLRAYQIAIAAAEKFVQP